MLFLRLSLSKITFKRDCDTFPIYCCFKCTFNLTAYLQVLIIQLKPNKRLQFFLNTLFLESYRHPLLCLYLLALNFDCHGFWVFYLKTNDRAGLELPFSSVMR